MRRFVLWLSVVGLIATACAPAEEALPSTSTSATSTSFAPTTSSTVPPSTSTTVSTTTSTRLADGVSDEVLLVANDDGVFRLDSSGSAKLLDGATWSAYTDRAGGIVYQPARRGPTEIWWSPDGGDPRMLVAGSADADVYSQDVSGDGELWYLETAGEWLDDRLDHLMSASLADGGTQERADLDFGWAPEYSFGDGLIALRYYPPTQHSTFAFAFLDESLSPVAAPWNPYDEPTKDEDCWLCGVHLAVSDDGRHVAWKVGHSLTVVDVETGNSREFPVPDGVTDVESIDVNAQAIVVNHAAYYDPGFEWLPTVRIDLETREVSTLEILGEARFAQE